MKQLEIRNGDFVLGPGGLGVVRGEAKLRQDLGIIMREALGDDRFHPRWGSVLGDYAGDIGGSESIGRIKGEIHRLIQNYMVVQRQQIEADVGSGRSPRHVPEEIIIGVSGIEIQQRYDRLSVKVSVQTLAGGTLALLRTVGV